MSGVAIADYALLSDCRSAALVNRQGSVDWLCFPRFDGASVFARLLDDAAGHWSIRVMGDVSVSRRYRDRSMLLDSEVRAGSGMAVLVDGLATGRGDRGHSLGQGSPGALLRSVRCERGSVDVELEFAPRPEYGLIRPLLTRLPGGIAAMGGAGVLTLSAPVAIQIEESSAVARFTLRAGESRAFALQQRAAWEEPQDLWTQATIESSLVETQLAWESWADRHQDYGGPWRDLVRQSSRVLQALTFQPTGAIVAAPTTSLPEVVGADRNWDHRYSWVRDANMTLDALKGVACQYEARRFFGWMCAAAASRVTEQQPQVMFGVGGEHDLSERELDHLGGWRGSRPVRVGNQAWNQRQFDVYGELLCAARRLRDRLPQLDGATRGFLADVADAAAARWREPDHGNWEVRGPAGHFVHSKLMCWLALACACDLAEDLGGRARAAGWAEVRDEIRRAILEEGWSERAGAFTQRFGSEELDASALKIPILGFLPPRNPRVRSTIRAVAERLVDDRGLVYRYRGADGQAGDDSGEGPFLICTFWLAHALAMSDELDSARAIFEGAIRHLNDVGLLAEQVAPGTGELLGNFPQASSHVALVNAARAIGRAEARAAAG